MNLNSDYSRLSTSDCDETCQIQKKIENLKLEYQDYLSKFIDAYGEYQQLAFGRINNYESRQLLLDYQKEFSLYENKINRLIDNLKENIEKNDKLIESQKTVIKNKNEMENKDSIYYKDTIDRLKKDNITDTYQSKQLDNNQYIYLFGFPPIKVKYNYSIYVLFYLNLLIVLVILFFIYKLIK